ncbi:MAG: hypothetical protein V8Q43_04165 [Christensenellaceae bacterium]
MPGRIGGAEALKRQAPNGLPGAAAGRNPGRRLRHRYAALEAAAEEMLKQSGGRPRKARVPRAADCVTIYARTMFDRSPARLAGIVLTGFSKGGVALEETLAAHPDASREAKALCRRVLAVQEQERPRFQRYCRGRR